MTRRIVLFSLVLMLLAGSGPAVAADAVPRYGTAEIVLSSTNLYDGAAGEPNPFDLAVTAEVVAPSGKRFTVPGFFDGDGGGGQRGRVFKVRVAAGEPGTWNWRIASARAGARRPLGGFRGGGRRPPRIFRPWADRGEPGLAARFPAAAGGAGIPARQVPRRGGAAADPVLPHHVLGAALGRRSPGDARPPRGDGAQQDRRLPRQPRRLQQRRHHPLAGNGGVERPAAFRSAALAHV